jgi:hypothetical protein
MSSEIIHGVEFIRRHDFANSSPAIRLNNIQYTPPVPSVVIYDLYVSYFTTVKSYWVKRVKILIYTRVVLYISSAERPCQFVTPRHPRLNFQHLHHGTNVLLIFSIKLDERQMTEDAREFKAFELLNKHVKTNLYEIRLISTVRVSHDLLFHSTE